MYSAVCNVQYAVYSVQCLVCSVQCAVYSVQYYTVYTTIERGDNWHDRCGILGNLRALNTALYNNNNTAMTFGRVFLSQNFEVALHKLATNKLF